MLWRTREKYSYIRDGVPLPGADRNKSRIFHEMGRAFLFVSISEASAGSNSPPPGDISISPVLRNRGNIRNGNIFSIRVHYAHRLLNRGAIIVALFQQAALGDTPPDPDLFSHNRSPAYYVGQCFVLKEIQV